MPIVKGKPEVISESRPKAVRTVRPVFARRIMAGFRGEKLPEGEVDPELLQQLRQRRAGRIVFEQLVVESGRADTEDAIVTERFVGHGYPTLKAIEMGGRYVSKYSRVSKPVVETRKEEKKKEKDTGDIPWFLKKRRFRRATRCIP